MTETNDSQVDRNYMGKFELFSRLLTYSPEGRFIISATNGDITVIDLFHSKIRRLCFDFSTATIGGLPLKTDNRRIFVESTFAFDLSTVFLVFTMRNPTYLGIGEVDLNRSRVFVKQTVKLAFHDVISHSKWFPLSYPANLYDGVISNVHNFGWECEFFHVKMGTNDDIQVSQLNIPMRMTHLGCFDGALYGLVYNETARRIDLRRQIDLVKFSISSGTYVQEPTVNWELVECSVLLDCVRTEYRSCSVGRRVFFIDLWNDLNKYKIISLDLDTKKWQSIFFEFSYYHMYMHSDGERTLIVSTARPSALIGSVRRFVYNEPDKLSVLAWLQLKRIFDARPSSYEFILSQIPANFKHKRPFSYL